MRMNWLYSLIMLLGVSVKIQAQTTWPVNDIANTKTVYYAFTNATVFKDSKTFLQNATLLIKDDKIVDIGTSLVLPENTIIMDCKGKFIYPSFIDLYSSYGIKPSVTASHRGRRDDAPQFVSNKPGAYGWNEAIVSDYNAGKNVSLNEEQAKKLRDLGFGVVLTHNMDGIARGTGALVSLQTENAQLSLLMEKASTHYSFNKGTSTQNYPASLMGSISLLRQTFYDAQWYKTKPATEGTNLVLQAINVNATLPAIFEANDKWNALRADRIGDEFGIPFILKTGGNEYQRIADIKKTNAACIVPLNFPLAIDVEDPTDARYVALGDMKHWELAPTNPASFEKNNIPFALTTNGIADNSNFNSNLKKAIQYGLTRQKALEALTVTPAQMIGATNIVGSLEKNKLANFIIATDTLFGIKTLLLQNWVQGKMYEIQKEPKLAEAKYALRFANQTYMVTYDKTASVVIKGTDTLKATITVNGDMVKMSFPYAKGKEELIILQGTVTNNTVNGIGTNELNNMMPFVMQLDSITKPKPDTSKLKLPVYNAIVPMPFNGYGFEKIPAQEVLLIKNATVWTSEKDGVLSNTDVLLQGGKIKAIGKNLAAAGAKVLDATGKHVTPGIIDEHSHIATAAVNEDAQSVTSEVRIADVVYPDDINIYRQLSGGVTTSHILHGSANSIGGQTQLLKLRWGANAEDMKFQNWDGFIKFALGENVKQSNWGETQVTRFPQTRMGVEQIMVDAFTRAQEYAKQPVTKRRDLELDALVEILNKKRFITCHSYVQSEINMLMKVADKFKFTVNTFTHILEGYKVADKMKAHGAHASTFSDWWAYKMEVQDAIPQNASIMQKAGLNVAINSDDAEMARRLNHEAAKSIKYDNMKEEDALKMVTINPATMLHVQDRVGSIKVGKDADVVIWTDHPLSIYAKVQTTIVDGVVYFDRTKDEFMQQNIVKERARLIQLLIKEKKAGVATAPPTPTFDKVFECEDVHFHHHNYLERNEHDLNN
jgi:imidazolonepropionase-like amidohydrolase